ncbi:hypothetical protein VNO77_32999 [Canavalia gladiata]|uniref:Uncharacterized protein n=1 Tax=Canavalia gladiata TaxID=3824 RepID=A0AAN9KCJ6_CANGL
MIFSLGQLFGYENFPVLLDNVFIEISDLTKNKTQLPILWTLSLMAPTPPSTCNRGKDKYSWSRESVVVVVVETSLKEKVEIECHVCNDWFQTLETCGHFPLMFKLGLKDRLCVSILIRYDVLLVSLGQILARASG